MSLSQLKFSDQVPPTSLFKATPVEKMRLAVLANIETQRVLLKIEMGETITLTKTVKKTNDAGVINEVVVTKRPRKWFWKDAKGVYLLQMIYGGHPVIINGKTSIEAGSAENVQKVLDILSNAVSKGELDAQLAAAKAQRKSSKKAA